jgi:hypothetical protein
MNIDKYLNIYSKSISVIFHPLIVTTLAAFIVFNSGHYLSLVDSGLKNSVYFIFGIMTFVIPSMFIPMLYYFSIVKSLTLDNKRDRVIALSAVSLLYAFCYYFMTTIVFPEILLNIVLASAISIAISALISSFYKISLHACGIGGIVALIISLFLKYNLEMRLFLIMAIIISGMIGFARLFLNKHNPYQIYLGWLVGFSIVFIVLLNF